ncbi:MAG: proton-conducting transporter membrane subunit [Hyphomonadaceae bacterium]
MDSGLLEIARAHAPFLVVIAPIVGAAAIIAVRHAGVCWLIACLSALAPTALAFDLVWRLAESGVAPLAQLAIATRVDGVGAAAAAVVSLASALAIFAAGALLGERRGPETHLVFALGLCMQGGWCGALYARDWSALFVAAEGAWLACVALIGLRSEKDRAALNGAMRMLISGGAASAFLLCGLAFLMRALGDARIEALAGVRLAAPAMAAAGASLALLALAAKAGVAPLHAWVGAALGRAQGNVALIAGVAGLAGALAVMMRVGAYASVDARIGPAVSTVLALLGAASAVIGSVQAIGATNVQRMAGYASGAQAGCLLLGVALGSPAGFASALVQLLAIMAGGAALVGAMAAGGAKTLADLDGYGRRAPLASAAITAAALSFMGAPLTIGFLGRWRLVEASVGAGWWWAAGVVIVVSLAGVFYGGRLIERIYFKRVSAVQSSEFTARNALLAPVLVAAIAAIAIGVAPGELLRLAAGVAAIATGVGP